MTQNLLLKEISQSVQQNLSELDIRLKPIHTLNIARVLELESEIRQYASHQQSDYFKKDSSKILLIGTLKIKRDVF